MKSLMTLALVFVLCAGTAFAHEDLPFGSQGDAVKQMQTRLQELGFYEKSIDGDYGDLSRLALMGFQSANGLHPTGEATADVLEKLYSDQARSIPHPPEVAVTAVKYRPDHVMQTITLRNHLNEDVESFHLRYITLDAEGRFHPDHSVHPADFAYEQSAWTDEISMKLPAGKTDAVTVHMLTGAHVLAAGVSAYRTASGQTVRLSTEQITYCTSEGNILYPPDDLQACIVMSDEEYERASGLAIGYSYCLLPSYTTELYGLPAGDYLIAVHANSMAERAGLKAGDVVTAIDGIPCTDPYDAVLAKQKLLDGESVVLTYWRGDASCDVMISIKEDLFDEEKGEPIHP